MKRFTFMKRPLSLLLSAVMLVGNVSVPYSTYAENVEEIEETISQEDEPNSSIGEEPQDSDSAYENENESEYKEEAIENFTDQPQEEVSTPIQENEEADIFVDGTQIESGESENGEVQTEELHEPVNLSDHVSIFLEKPWMRDPEGRYIEGAEEGNTLDYSMIPASELGLGGFSLSFKFDEPENEVFSIRAGDYIEVSFADILSGYAIEDTEYVRFVYTEKGWEEDLLDPAAAKETIGFWEKEPGTGALRFSFCEGDGTRNLTQLIMRAELSYDLGEILEKNRDADGQEPDLEVFLQPGKIFYVKLPAEEKEVSEEPDEETGDISEEAGEMIREEVTDLSADPTITDPDEKEPIEDSIEEGEETGDTEITEKKDETAEPEEKPEEENAENIRNEKENLPPEKNPSAEKEMQEEEPVEILPEEELEDTGDGSMPLGEDLQGGSFSTFTVTGQLAFDEMIDGKDWKDLLRPLLFEANLYMEVSALGPNGETYTDRIKTQEYAGQDPFYLEMIPDGSGGGSFSIRNVPNQIEVNGVPFTVEMYRVVPDLTDLPYYTCAGFEVTEMENTTTLSTLFMQVAVHEAALQPTVVGGHDPAGFEMTVTCYKKNGVETEIDSIVRNLKPTSDTPGILHIPNGLDIRVSQTEAEGYQFTGNYYVKEYGKGEVGSDLEYVLPDDHGDVLLQVTSDVEIRTVNYAQNVTYEIRTVWVDNNNESRPHLSAENFVLMYQDPSGSWIEVDQQILNEWTGMPEGEDYNRMSFEASEDENGLYMFRGLPGADLNGNPIEYRVAERSENRPAGYDCVSAASDESGVRFVYHEILSFMADINWLDNKDAEKFRLLPEELVQSIRLKRRVNGAEDTEFNDRDDLEIRIIVDENSHWKLESQMLPRYRDDNEEYDYYVELLQPVDHYATTYNNGTGNYGNDIQVCHNGGAINNLITGVEVFSAHKIWMDEVIDSQERPDAVVTLWRYAVGEPGEAYDTGIDANFNNQNAARVVYHFRDSSGTYKDILLSYALEKEDTSTIHFDSETVQGLPGLYQLPAYDEAGRRYVYFVRETVDSDQYDTVYVHNSHTDQQGAADGGTIKNIRREKAAISVDKIWQCPTHLGDLSGVKVELSIWAPDPDTDEYKELVVYSPEQDSYAVLTGEDLTKAQTIEGFSENISTLNTLFYVNICTGEGRYYDMSRAFVKELTITESNGAVHKVSYQGKVGDFVLSNGDRFEAVSEYVDPGEGGQPYINGVKQFGYTEKNTITGTREYELVKEWGASIPEEDYTRVDAVNFKVKRRSTRNPRKDRSDFTYISRNPDGSYREVASAAEGGLFRVENEFEQHRADKDHGFGRIWDSLLSQLPKYDEEGYEYEYEGEEVSLLVEGQIRSLRDMGWYCLINATEDRTVVTNYKTGGPDQVIDIRKEWNDNGDLENRKEVLVRIYNRRQLAAVLETLGTEMSQIRLDALEDLPYYQIRLNKENGWRNRYISLRSVEKAVNPDVEITDDNIMDLNPTDYVILEYRIGGEAGSETLYPIEQLYAAANLKNLTLTSEITIEDGFTETSLRDYETVINTVGAQTIINNIRSGKVHAVIHKVWKDENNRNNTRPREVCFRIEQDHLPYYPTYKELERIELSGQVAGAAEDAPKPTLTLSPQGTLTVSFTDPDADKGDWTVEIRNLPMFSEEGKSYSYNIKELRLDEANKILSHAEDPSAEDAVYEYFSEKGETYVSATSKEKNYEFSFTNTITGTSSHTAYKQWKDAATEGRHRPDLYITAYQYLLRDLEQKGEDYDLFADPDGIACLFMDYKDQIWTTYEQEGSPEGEDFDWKISIHDLPTYDENGRKYGYIFKEVMNNAGQTVDGIYVAESERILTSDGDSREFFTNTITDWMKKKGVKTWYGMDEKFKLTKNDYPTPKITLYRSVDPITKADLDENGSDLELVSVQELTEDQLKTLTEGSSPRLELVNRTKLNPAVSNDYTFPDVSALSEEERADAVKKNLFTFDGANYYLPKFDPQGRRYEYYVFESFEDNEIAGQLYTKVAVNGNLTNTFKADVNRRQITVTKDWDNRTRQQLMANEYGKYPSVTFELYRYEEGTDPENAVEIDRVRIDASHFKEAETEPGVIDPQKLYTHTFHDLLIYSPKGIRYNYYIKEKSINGYETAYTDDETADMDAMEESVAGTPWADVTSKANLTASQEQNDAGVTIVNRYIHPGRMKIQGYKVWEDYSDSGYIFGKRPDFIEIELYRYTNSESGQNNAIAREKVELIVYEAEKAEETKPYIVWEKGTGTDSDKWKYTIFNLEQYAPNGMPFIYAVNEKTKADGYAENTQNIQANADKALNEADGNASLSVDDLVNRLNMTYEVSKTWLDGRNRYGFRPSQITVVLERSIDGINWNSIPVGEIGEESSVQDLPSVTRDDEGRPIVSVQMTAADVVKNTGGMKWSYKFLNLPALDPHGHEWKYRCRETMIGSAEVVNNEAGAYTCSHVENEAGTRTDITNTQKDTKLLITKEWLNDSDDMYHSRPQSLSFVLQMRGERITDTDQPETETTQAMKNWMPVTGEDGNPYIFTIHANVEGQWETTLTDLPVAMMGADGSYYKMQFRGYEQTTQDTGEGRQIIGAKNYIDLTDYSDGSSDHIIDAEHAQSVSHIKNQLIRDPIEIKVHKQWYNMPGIETTMSTFELQYASDPADTADWKCFGRIGSDQVSEHSADKNCLLRTIDLNGGKYDSVDDTIRWENLPKYDLEGHRLYYRVIEYPVEGFSRAEESKTTAHLVVDGKTENVDTYSFTNIQLQSYTVTKIWQNTDYAEKENGAFTAEIVLQRRRDLKDWQQVGEPIRLSTTAAGDTLSYTWTDLPIFDTDSTRFEYRAVETRSNGQEVGENGLSESGAYIASYRYRGDVEDSTTYHEEPVFANQETEITNRMVYGFVDLKKAAAYVDPSTDLYTEVKDHLSGVSFDLWKDGELWASGIQTDAEGHLIVHEDGTYGGEEARYLTIGTYTIVETATAEGYSKWSMPIEFTVGARGEADTGEHGTAVIRTTTENGSLSYDVSYEPASGSHTYRDDCQPVKAQAKAYNLESRGRISFTKDGTDSDRIPLNTHESEIYFGVYLDEACLTQAAGMMPDPNDPTHMVLTDQASGTENAETLSPVYAAEDLPYLRNTHGVLTLLSGTYYIREETPPPGYKKDTTVRTAVIPSVETKIDGQTDLAELYTANIGTIDGSTGYIWRNVENELEIFKMDQYGRKVTLKPGQGLTITAPAGTTFKTGTGQITLCQDIDAPSLPACTGISYHADSGSWTLKGFFDGDGKKIYTLSEPLSSVPDANLAASPITFKVTSEGELELAEGADVKNGEGVSVTDAVGNDYSSYYRTEGSSQVVLRDIARYFDLTITKLSSKNNQPIENIYFKIYKVTGPDTSKALLADEQYLITDAKGQVCFRTLDDAFINQDTGKPLKYGLTVGAYYLEELERGAADKYVLKSRIEFEIRSDETNEAPGTRIITWNGNGDTTIQNDPVTDQRKELDLVKKDGETREVLENAEYTLYYSSDTKEDDGSDVKEIILCRTDANGQLFAVRITDNQGVETTPAAGTKPDISRKGDYILRETKVPDGYMTPTDGEGKLQDLLRFTVSDPDIVTVTYANDAYVDGETSLDIQEGKPTRLALTALNDQTKIYIDKRIDSAVGGYLKGAHLEILEVSENESGSREYTPVYDFDTPESGPVQIPGGVLKENAVYCLRETTDSAPVGYLEMQEDIWFEICGTVIRNSERVSKIRILPTNGYTQEQVQNETLEVIDETIKAPVNLTKVLKNGETETTLANAVFEIHALRGSDNTPILLGCVKTNENGRIQWSEAVPDHEWVVKKDHSLDVILRQNGYGYRIHEIGAADDVYLEEKILDFDITDEDYLHYREDPSFYKELAEPGKTNVVNLPFEAAFELYKYDAENPQINTLKNNFETIGLEGVAFTLSIRQEDGTYVDSDETCITGENGLLHIPIVRKGTYKLVEKTPLTGYKSNPKVIEFTVNNEHYKKTLTCLDTDEGGQTIIWKDENGDPVESVEPYALPNEREHGQVILNKIDQESGAGLNEVWFVLKRIEPSERNEEVDRYFPPAPTLSMLVETGKIYANLSDAERAEDIVITDTTDGLLKIEDLQWGTYTLTEVQTLDGYIQESGSFTFTVDDKGLSKTVGDLTLGSNLYVGNIKNRLTLKKTDPDGKALSGAEFKLFHVRTDEDDTLILGDPVSFCKEAAETGKTETILKDGQMTAYGLGAGTYLLREEKAPEGYEITRDILFNMGTDGQVLLLGNGHVDSGMGVISLDEGAPSNASLSITGEGAQTANELSVKDDPIEIRLMKVLADQTVPDDGRGAVSYEITGRFAGDTQSSTRTFSGNRLQDELKAVLAAGETYSIQEITAPGGYKITDSSENPATIFVDKMGHVQVRAGDAFLQAGIEENGLAILTFMDQPIEPDLKKQGPDGEDLPEEILGSAEFTLSGRLVDETGTKIEEISVSGLTTDQFKTRLTGRLIGDEIYRIEETKAPKGYKLAPVFYIRLDKQGKIAERGSDPDQLAACTDVSETVSVQDDPTEITFRKKDEDGNPLAGARFELTAYEPTEDPAFVNLPEALPAGVDIWNDQKIAWTSGADGSITLTNTLITGRKYKLVEKGGDDRIKDHEVMTGSVIFHLTEDTQAQIAIDPETTAVVPNFTDLEAASVSGIEMSLVNPSIKGSVELTKTGVNKPGTEGTSVLAGAAYKLYRTHAADGSAYANAVQVYTDANAVYVPAGGTKGIYVTDTEGKIRITGLPEGKYYFLETDAPAAFVIQNDPEKNRIEFEIHEGTQAHTSVSQTDERINAKIQLLKQTTSADGTTQPLASAVFKVEYREPQKTEERDFWYIANVMTGEDGRLRLEKLIYDADQGEEGLRRGTYRFTEIQAQGQMLNTTDFTRNGFIFEIGNTKDSIYEVNHSLMEAEGSSSFGMYMSFPEDGGIKDVPIPKKQVTVTKQWAGEENMSETYRPAEVKVQLYRSYDGRQPVAFGEIRTLNQANNWQCSWTDLDAYVNAPLDDGGEKTCLYTYTVEEVEPVSWYTVSEPVYTIGLQGYEAGIEDGDTQADLTNTLKDLKKLSITKQLGGGKTDHIFFVRVLLKAGDTVIGKYVNDYSLSGRDETRTPDEEGYAEIHAGETLEILIPEGVSYEVEEKAPQVQGGLSYETHYDEDRTGTMGEDPMDTVITNAVVKHLDLTKVDENENVISDPAEFSVSYQPLEKGRYTGEAYEKTFNTDMNGSLKDNEGREIDLTLQGTYTIRETKAPQGFITPTDNNGGIRTVAVITVDADDILRVQKGTDSQIQALTQAEVNDDGSTVSITLKNETTQAKVPIVKTVDFAIGDRLAGARLQIFSGDTKVAEWTTTDHPYFLPDTALIEHVIYRLHETEGSAPTGYLETEDLYFKLDGTYTVEDGSRYARMVLTDSAGEALEDQNTAGDVYAASGVVSGMLAVVDPAIRVPVTLKKVLGPDGTHAIEGVQFSVVDHDHPDASARVAVTGSDGILLLENGEGIVLQQNMKGYTFTEVMAPDSVYNDGNSFTIHLTDNNFRDYLANPDLRLNIATGEMKNPEAFEQEDLVVNQPYVSTVALRKFDADEEAAQAPIPNTEFTLFRIEEGQEIVYGKACAGGETDRHTDGIFKTGADGDLAIEIPEKGTYILRETRAAVGYELPEGENAIAFTFTLIDDANEAYGYGRTTVLNEAGVSNVRIRGSLSLKKVDQDSREALNGVVYTLSRSWEETPEQAYLLNTPEDFATGKKYTAVKLEDGSWGWTETDLPESQAGELIVEGLNWGTYRIQEKTELSGYVRSDAYYDFTVTAEQPYFKFNSDLTNTRNEILLHKQESFEADGSLQTRNLAGAVFEIHEGDGSTCGSSCTKASFHASADQIVSEETPKITEVITRADGTVKIYGLPTEPGSDTPKTYHLAETVAPLGYKLAPAVTFTVDRDGKIRIGNEEKTEVQMNDEPIRLYIEKVGETNEIRLSGAVFELTDVCETCEREHKLANDALKEEGITTGADGKVLIPIGRVIAGHTYQLRETKAPDGYECTVVLTFGVSADGTMNLLTQEGTGSAGAAVDQAGCTLTIPDNRIDLTLEKVDLDDPSVRLEGVVFTLEPDEGSAFKADYEDQRLSGGVLTLTTGADGTTDVPSGLLIHDHTYILTETSLGSNLGYKLAEEEENRRFRVRVEKDGSLRSLTEDARFVIAADADGSLTRIRVKNEKIRFSVLKKDQTHDSPLAGVQLKLSRLEKDSWVPVSLNGKTDTDGKWITGTEPLLFTSDANTILFPAVYKLEEAEAPEGYNRVQDALIFEITQSGRMIRAKIGADGTDTVIPADADGYEIGICKNFRIRNPEDGKAGQIGIEVVNAAYTDLQVTKRGTNGDVLEKIEFMLMRADGSVVGTKTTAVDGTVVFEDLPDGQYLLEETKTASGYNLLSDRITITIDRNHENHTIRYDGEEQAAVITRISDTDRIEITVINQKGFVLPATGTSTPKLPGAVLPITLLLEGLFLYLYGVSGKRRRRR